jgi:hypothetical protein
LSVVALAELTQLPASAANAALTFLGIISPRRRLRAEIIADKQLQNLFDKDSDAYRMLDERTTFDVALLTEHLVPANKKKTNWSSAAIGLVMLIGFAWWTWRLHEAHSGWQWLTGTLASFGFFGMLGSRTPAQPAPRASEEPPPLDAANEAGDEPPADEGPTPLAPRRVS